MTLQDRLTFFEQLQNNGNNNSNNGNSQKVINLVTNGPTVHEETVIPGKRVSLIKESFLHSNSVAKNINTSVSSYKPSKESPSSPSSKYTSPINSQNTKQTTSHHHSPSSPSSSSSPSSTTTQQQQPYRTVASLESRKSFTSSPFSNVSTTNTTNATSTSATSPITKNKRPVSVHATLNNRLSFSNQSTTNNNNNTNSCAVCSKTVYFMDQILIDNQPLHKTCLKCEHCKMTIKLGNFAALEGKYYVK